MLSHQTSRLHRAAALRPSQLEATGDPLGEGSETLDMLVKWLRDLEAGVGTASGMDAEAVGGAEVDGDEDRGMSLAHRGRAQIGSPDFVSALGVDDTVVRFRTVWPST